MTIHVSQVMGFRNSTHSEIDFVDVVLSPDTKLFLDPRLIEIGRDKWSIQAHKTISSYFNCFYSLYSKHAPINSKIELFEHAHEINATKLGYGRGHNGKAKTPEGMIATFSTIDSLFHNGINMQYASDLPIFIRDFAEDCLSDMLTNILFKVLSDFTIEQCRKYNVETYPIPKGYHYWDNFTGKWQSYNGKCLLHEGKVILLVPKHFVRNRYFFNTSQYFQRVILGKIQENEAWTDSSGKQQKPTKKSLRKKYKGELSTLECSIKLTNQNPQYLSAYHELLPTIYVGRGMSDDELDEILYGT